MKCIKEKGRKKNSLLLCNQNEKNVLLASFCWFGGPVSEIKKILEAGASPTAVICLHKSIFLEFLSEELRKNKYSKQNTTKQKLKIFDEQEKRTYEICSLFFEYGMPNDESFAHTILKLFFNTELCLANFLGIIRAGLKLQVNRGLISKIFNSMDPIKGLIECKRITKIFYNNKFFWDSFLISSPISTLLEVPKALYDLSEVLLEKVFKEKRPIVEEVEFPKVIESCFDFFLVFSDKKKDQQFNAFIKTIKKISKKLQKKIQETDLVEKLLSISIPWEIKIKVANFFFENNAKTNLNEELSPISNWLSSNSFMKDANNIWNFTYLETTIIPFYENSKDNFFLKLEKKTTSTPTAHIFESMLFASPFFGLMQLYKKLMYPASTYLELFFFLLKRGCDPNATFERKDVLDFWLGLLNDDKASLIQGTTLNIIRNNLHALLLFYGAQEDPEKIIKGLLSMNVSQIKEMIEDCGKNETIPPLAAFEPKSGVNALMLTQDIEKFKFLLDNGVPWDQEDVNRKTVLDYHKGKPDFIEAIEKHKKKGYFCINNFIHSALRIGSSFNWGKDTKFLGGPKTDYTFFLGPNRKEAQENYDSKK